MNSYRVGWITLASANPYLDPFGVSRKLTGSAMFTKLNRNLATLAISSILHRTGHTHMRQPIEYHSNPRHRTARTFSVTTSVAAAGGEAVVIRATTPLSPGVNQIGQTQTIIATYPAGTAGPYAILTPYKHNTQPSTRGKPST